MVSGSKEKNLNSTVLKASIAQVLDGFKALEIGQMTESVFLGHETLILVTDRS